MNRALPVLAIATSLSVLIFILLIQPFFGVMDDAVLLREAQRLENVGLIAGTIDYLREDIALGMFRPLYPLMIRAVYGTAGDNSILLFILNYFFVTFCLLVFGCAFFWALARHYFDDQRPTLFQFASLYTLTTLAFPWTHDLYVHPSLQEKLVLLAAAANVYWFGRSWQKIKPIWFYVISTLLLAIGFSTKAQFLIFVPAILVLIAEQKKVSQAGRIYFFGLSTLLVVSLAYVSTHGWYTMGFGPSHMPENITSPYFFMLITFAALSFYSAYKLRRWKWAATAPGMIVLGYLLIFTQWKFVGYLLSSIGATVGVIVALYIFQLRPRQQAVTMVLAMAIAMVITFYRSYAFFGYLADIRNIVFSSEAEILARDHATIYMSCTEGAEAMHYYFDHFRGLDISVKPISEFEPGSHRYFIADTKFCPMDTAGKSIHFPAKTPGGFAVYVSTNEMQYNSRTP